MAKEIYIGVDGVARKADQPYIGVNGVARTVAEGYVGVNGVARKCYSSGKTWHKYSCTTVASEYHYGNRTYPYGGYTTLVTVDTASDEVYVYVGYGFTESDGFYGTNGKYVEAQNAKDCYFGIIPTRVYIVTTTYENSSGKYVVYGVRCAECDKIVDSYDYKRGSTYYGAVKVPAGEPPEDGTLIDGSYGENSTRCVLQVNGTLYYYSTTKY